MVLETAGEAAAPAAVGSGEAAAGAGASLSSFKVRRANSQTEVVPDACTQFNPTDFSSVSTDAEAYRALLTHPAVLACLPGGAPGLAKTFAVQYAIDGCEFVLDYFYPGYGTVSLEGFNSRLPESELQLVLTNGSEPQALSVGDAFCNLLSRGVGGQGCLPADTVRGDMQLCEEVYYKGVDFVGLIGICKSVLEVGGSHPPGAREKLLSSLQGIAASIDQYATGPPLVLTRMELLYDPFPCVTYDFQRRGEDGSWTRVETRQASNLLPDEMELWSSFPTKPKVGVLLADPISELSRLWMEQSSLRSVLDSMVSEGNDKTISLMQRAAESLSNVLKAAQGVVGHATKRPRDEAGAAAGSPQEFGPFKLPHVELYVPAGGSVVHTTMQNFAQEKPVYCPWNHALNSKCRNPCNLNRRKWVMCLCPGDGSCKKAHSGVCKASFHLDHLGAKYAPSAAQADLLEPWNCMHCEGTIE